MTNSLGASENWLRRDVHDPVVARTAERDDAPLAELAELADLVTASPVGAEDELPPRERVFVRLLRRGALEPAWLVAQENGAGVVKQTRSFATSSGVVRTAVRLPLHTVLEDGRCYAWLAGFRDPRWGVPDHVYDISVDVQARAQLDTAEWRGNLLTVAGWAHLSLLPAGAGDAVAICCAGPGGAQERVAARRLRRPDLVKGTGDALTRLAWAGWRADLDVATLAARPGIWQFQLEVGQGGVVRSVALGRRRGPLGQPEVLANPRDLGSAVLRLDAAASGALRLRVSRRSAVAQMVPRSLRDRLRGRR